MANKLLSALVQASADNTFEGKLRQIANDAGLNSVRSAEAIKLLEEIERIRVVQRGRRGRDTIIEIRSTSPVRLEDAESLLPSRATRRAPKLSYDQVGKAVVDRLLELARDDGLRAAQVEAFDRERSHQHQRIKELEEDVEAAARRETDLRIKLKSAEEALVRAEENLRRALGPQPSGDSGVRMEDDEARAVLDILRSGHA